MILFFKFMNKEKINIERTLVQCEECLKSFPYSHMETKELVFESPNYDPMTGHCDSYVEKTGEYIEVCKDCFNS